jgi:hypothetical protein
MSTRHLIKTLDFRAAADGILRAGYKVDSPHYSTQNIALQTTEIGSRKPPPLVLVLPTGQQLQAEVGVLGNTQLPFKKILKAVDPIVMVRDSNNDGERAFRTISASGARPHRVSFNVGTSACHAR